jgi:hypothetical protein
MKGIPEEAKGRTFKFPSDYINSLQYMKHGQGGDQIASVMNW